MIDTNNLKAISAQLDALHTELCELCDSVMDVVSSLDDAIQVILEEDSDDD